MSTQAKRPDGLLPQGWLQSAWVRRLVIAMTILAWIAIAGVAFWFIGAIGYPLLLMIISMIIAYALYPLVKMLRRFMPAPIAILITYLVLFIGLMLILYYILWAALTQLISLAHQIQQNLPVILEHLKPITDTLQQGGVSQEQLTGSSRQLINQVLGAAGKLLPLAFGIFALVISCIIVTTLSVYFILDGPRIANWLRTQPPTRQRMQLAYFLATLDRIMGGALRGQLLVAVITTTIMGIGLFLIGIHYVMLLVLVIFILEFVPQIGSYISAAIVVLFALVTSGWQAALIVAVFSALVQGGLDGQILIPRILGGAVGLHPIVAMFALLIGAALFGLAGAIFAAPIAGIVQVFLVSAWRTWERGHSEQFLEAVEQQTRTEETEKRPEPGTGAAGADNPFSSG